MRKMNLNETSSGEYTVESIQLDDESMTDFLFRLGCYAGESIALISRKKKILVVAIKDGRYCIDSALAAGIKVKAKGEK